VTLTRTGDFSDPRYGKFSITLAMLQQMARDFDARVVARTSSWTGGASPG